MISQTAEYALRAVLYVASRAGEPMTAPQVAAATCVPGGYLSKILQSLARCGLLHSQRGLHGGFTLARPAAQITVLDVVNAVDPLKRIRTCPLGLPEHVGLCPLHRRLDEAVAHVEQAFASYTLAELLEESQAQPDDGREHCRGPGCRCEEQVLSAGS